VVIEPGVFVGSLRHRRHAPVGHAFTYGLFMVLLDIDRIPALMSVTRLVSHNRPNWATFDDRDHLGDPTLPLRTRLERDAAGAQVELPDGPIFLLTHLRYLGYCFNPVSFFYCFDRDSRLALVAAEVHNTAGASRTYWLQPERDGRTFRARASKTLDVSPFLPADLEYRFALTTPAARHVVAHIDVVRGGSRVFDATLSLERRPWSAKEIRRCLLRHPAMTVSVMAAIHWQAFTLWWKGVPVIPAESGAGRREGARAW
jgi:DUF1365 family protein